jgi:hypothetical protein
VNLQFERLEGEWGYWVNEVLVAPAIAAAPLPHPDMPEDVQTDYIEARDVASRSPRSACALLRLAHQKLCISLGEKGKNLNDDIASLVKKGLPVEVQQAPDALRVFGNHAVHPGELDLQDDHASAQSLFGVLNFIVEQRIAQPRKLAELYGQIPEGALQQIERRDATHER